MRSRQHVAAGADGCRVRACLGVVRRALQDLVQVVLLAAEVRGATEERSELHPAGDVLRMLPDVGPEDALITQASLHGAGDRREEASGARTLEAPGDLSHWGEAGDPVGIGVQGLEELPPGLLVASQAAERLAVDVAVLSVVGRLRHRLVQGL